MKISENQLKRLESLSETYISRGYILGVLTHITAWDQHWGGDEILRLNIRGSALPHSAIVDLAAELSGLSNACVRF